MAVIERNQLKTSMRIPCDVFCYFIMNGVHNLQQLYQKHIALDVRSFKSKKQTWNGILCRIRGKWNFSVISWRRK